MRSIKYEESLKAITFRSVSLGFMAVHLFDVEQLPEGQLGYSIATDGNSLIGDEEGSWKEGWLVIGYEDLCGDPIFIDILAEAFPVYTAMHGAGSWDARLIADSLDGFITAMKIVASLSAGRENPVELESNPISPDDLKNALADIQKTIQERAWNSGNHGWMSNDPG